MREVVEKYTIVDKSGQNDAPFMKHGIIGLYSSMK